jgi:hypothetical protein
MQQSHGAKSWGAEVPCFAREMASRHRRRGDVIGNASDRCGRSRSYSAVHNGPSTIDVVFELNNHELLITDDALDKIAD